MIKLWDTENLPLEDLERVAYATDDNVVVSIKMVRALATRALRMERKHADELGRLNSELDELEARFSEAEDA